MRHYTTNDGSIRSYKQSRDIPRVKCWCLFCNREFIGFIGKKYCSRECTHSSHNYMKAVGPKIKTCIACNRAFITQSQTGHNTTCSRECYKQAEASRVIVKNRASKARRYELVNKITVFSLHNWHCVMCGVHTPKELMGSYRPNEPTLDHIIPLSKGGTHTNDNVQLLCRRCNCHVKNNRL